MKVRKKPVVVDAEIFDGTLECAEKLALWIGSPAAIGEGRNSTRILSIQTLEGVMRAEHGDWIIRGVEGEFYPCKPAIFAKTYEPV